MRSFRINKISTRRAAFLSLESQIGGQIRDAYQLRHDQGLETQSSLAKKLGVGRSAIHRRLSGSTNMTIQSLADLLWALGHAIKISIYDPAQRTGQNYFPGMAADDVMTATTTLPPAQFPQQMPPPPFTPN